MHGGARELELNLGHVCNNRCLFCVSGQLTARGQATHAPIDGLRAALRAGAADGVRRVTLLGGEPTLHPELLPLLDEIVALRIPEVVLFTNGARVGDARFLDAVCARGPLTWRFSIQGGDLAAHDHVTQRKGAFARIVQGLEALSARGQRLTVNMCVNGENLDRLDALPAVLGRCGVSSFHADMVRPHSVGERSAAELDALVAPYPVVAAALRRMLRAFAQHAPQVDVRIGNLPFCVLPEAAHRIEHGGQQTETRTADAEGRALGAGVDKYAYQAAERSHPAVCDGCRWRARCVGLPLAYLSRHGTEGIGDPGPRWPEAAPRAGIRAQPRPAPTVATAAALPSPRSPAAHLAGTRALLSALARVAGAGALDPRIDALLGDPAGLPAVGEGLKYDAYMTSAPDGLAWGFTINSRWEGEVALSRFGTFAHALRADYAWDGVEPFWRRSGGVLTLGVGFDRPGAPPRLKLYAQEDVWGAGLVEREAAEAQVGAPLPAWWGPRVDVLTLELMPGGATRWKAYRGAASAEAAAAGGPPAVVDLAERIGRFSPLGPAWYYLTARLGETTRFAMNKVYAHGAVHAARGGAAAWRDTAALFASAGATPRLEALLREVLALRGVKVVPTATALEGGGRSADVYCAAWAVES